MFKVIDYDLPSKEEVSEIVTAFSSKIERACLSGKSYRTVSAKQQEQIRNACLGLTENEIKMILSECIFKCKTLDVNFVLNAKIQSVKKSGVLDYKVPKITLKDIGGNHALTKWLLDTKELFESTALEFGVSKPKGFMGVGIPGAGKTAIAEAFAGEMGIPLLSLSAGKIMNRMVGESEKKIAQALAITKSCSPCVFLIDEAEKLLGGINSSNNSDSGVTARVFQEILKFMNDNDSGVYVIMTSNDVSQLPPELTRSGRLDAQWYFGLPSEKERKEIFKIHYQKNNKEINDNLLNISSKNSLHFTGSEIEEAVKNSIRKAFIRSRKDKNTKITKEDILLGLAEVIPIYTSSKEKIVALENYCAGRARRTDNELDISKGIETEENIKFDFEL